MSLLGLYCLTDSYMYMHVLSTPMFNVHYHGNHFFSTHIALKGGHIQGSLLYQCTLNQLKVT